MKISMSQSIEKKLSEAITQALKEGHTAWLHKLMFVQTCNYFPSVESACEAIQVCRTTLYQWISTFACYGPWALKPKGKSGRPPKLNKTQKRELSRIIHQGPLQAGYKRGGWTASMLQELIQKRYRVVYQVKYIPELLKRLGFRHKKLSIVSHKADQEVQNAWRSNTLPELLKKARQERAVILFEDECTLRIWSQAEYTWAYRGKKPVAKVHMGSHRKEVMGAVNLRSGKFIYTIVKKRGSQTFLDFLKYLKKIYPKRKVYLVCDNGPIHRGKILKPWLEQNASKLELVFLPSYSPQFNPIERLWKQIKQNHFHGVLFQTKPDFDRTLKKALKAFQNHPEGVLSLMKTWRKLDNQIRDLISTHILDDQEVQTLVA